MTRIQILFVFVVLALCVPACLAQSAAGLPAFGSFQNGTFDSINLANSNVHFTIPVINKQGRGIPFVYNLSYDSSIWSVGYSSGLFRFQPATNWGWRQTSEMLTGYIRYTQTQVICSQQNGTAYWKTTYNAYIDRAGTAHNINLLIIDPSTIDIGCNVSPITSASGAVSDGAGYIVSITNVSNVLVTSPSGEQIVPPALPSPCATCSTGGPGSLTDSNGNQITTDGTHFTDTLGTQVLSVSGSATAPPVRMTYISPTGASVGVALSYTSYSIKTNFQCSGSNWLIADYASTGTVPLITTVTMPDGTAYSLTYEDTPGYPGYKTGRLSSISLPSGGTISYSYSGGNNGINCVDASPAVLTRTTPDGTWTYTHSISGDPYNGPAWPASTTVLDPQGNETALNFQKIYETSRYVYQGTTSLLQTIPTCYNGATSPCDNAAITLPITRRTAITQLPNSSGPTSEVDSTYTASGLPTETDEYDFANGTPGALLRRTITTYGTWTGSSCAALGNNILNRPCQLTVEDGGGNIKAQTTYTYDGTGVNPTSSPQHVGISGSRGNPTTISYLVGSGSGTLSRAFTYFDTGLVQTATDTNGNSTSYAYGNCGNSFPTNVGLPLGLTTSQAWNCIGGVVTSTTDPNQQTTTYGYGDPNYWRVTQTSYPDGGQRTTTYNLTSTPWNISQTTKVTSALNATAEQVFDSQGRPSQQQLTSDPEGVTYKDTTYDIRGRLGSISNAYRATSDPTYGVTSFNYDPLNRPTVQIQPDSSVIMASYSGTCVTVSDEAGNPVTRCVDGLGRLTAVIEPGDTGGANWETDYQYDVLNNLISVTQKGGTTNSALWRIRSYVYDGLGRLTSLTTPEAGTSNYFYATSAGGLCSGDPAAVCRRTDARGITITYAYDGLNRPTGKTYSDTTSAVTYLYDQTLYNGLQIANGKGRRTGMSDGSGATAWSYDAMGRVLTRTQTIGTVTKSIAHTYNLDGTLATLTYPSGRIVTYTVSGAERATAAGDGKFNFASSANYAPAGLLANVIYGAVTGWNAITLKNTFNNRLQLAGVLATSPVPSTLLNLSIDYGYAIGLNNGIVHFITNNLDNTRSIEYGYDSENRVTQALTDSSTVWGDAYTYDPWGNLLSKTVTQGTGENLSVQVNAKNQVTTSGFQYDAAGNLTWDTYNALRFDAENRPTPVSGDTYVYDGDRRRVQKSSGTTYWMDDNRQPLSISNNTGTISRDYIYFGGSRIAFVSLSSGNSYYFLGDQLGSSRVVASGDGKAIMWDADYYPFGGIRIVTNNLTNPYRFTGYEYDSGTGYYNADFRLQSPVLGRFMSPDPVSGNVADPQSWNQYAYVRNSPLNVVDPHGLFLRPACDSDEPCELPDAPMPQGPPPLFPNGTHIRIDANLAFSATNEVVRTGGLESLIMDTNSVDVTVVQITLVPTDTDSLDNGLPVGVRQTDNWWRTFATNFFTNFSLRGARQPGESVGTCLSRVRAVGGSATTVADAVSGVGLISYVSTTPLGTTTEEVYRGIGVQVSNLSVIEGAAYSAAAKGLITPSIASMVGRVAAPIAKFSGLPTAIAIGLEGGAVLSCR